MESFQTWLSRRWHKDSGRQRLALGHEPLLAPQAKRIEQNPQRLMHSVAFSDLAEIRRVPGGPLHLEYAASIRSGSQKLRQRAVYPWRSGRAGPQRGVPHRNAVEIVFLKSPAPSAGTIKWELLTFDHHPPREFSR